MHKNQKSLGTSLGVIVYHLGIKQTHAANWHTLKPHSWNAAPHERIEKPSPSRTFICDNMSCWEQYLCYVLSITPCDQLATQGVLMRPNTTQNTARA